MPGSTYSTNLKVELMATGENSGTWGDITNTNLGTALEQAIVGYGNPNYSSDANLTISITNSNAAQAARALVLNVTSSVSLTATRELVVPTIQKQYIVQNNTTGSQSITVKTSAGTGITVPNGRKAHLYVDGTNVIQMFDFVDINGGAIDGTPIGASSASTGAFTTLNASGATTLDGNVTLGNASGDNVTVTGTITSNLLFTDNTYDIGASGATRPRNLFLAGAATIGGNLSVGGTLTLTGGVNLNGNVTVGDNASDTLTINSTITSNLLFTDNTYDIGASGATRPRNLFLAGNATIGGNQTLTGSLTVDSTTDSSSTTTGSIQTDGGLGVAKALFVGTSGTIQNVLGVGAASTTDAVALFDSLNANGSHIRLLNANTANTYFGAAAGFSSSGTASDTALRAQGAFYLLTNGNNPRVTVTTAGYVGIRTTSPAGFLHVAPGNAASSGDGAPIILQAQQGATGNAGGNILIGSGQNGPGGSNGYIAFGTGSATSGSAFSSGERMRLTNNGNVVIGTTTDLFNGQGLPLVVGTGSSNQGLTIYSGSTGYGTIQFADTASTGADSYRGVVSYKHGDEFMYFSTDATERVRISSDGTFRVKGAGTAGSTDAVQFSGAAPASSLFLDSVGSFGIGALPTSKLDVRSGYITAGTSSSTNGSKILAGYYTSGALSTWGSEYSNGSAVMGYGVWPSTAASGAFVSSSPINVFRGAYMVSGNQHIWYGGGAQAVAIDSPVSMSELGRFDAAGALLIGTQTSSSGKLVSYYTSTAAAPLSPSNAGLNVWGSSSVRLLFGTDTASPYAAYIQASNTGTGFPIALNPSGGNVGVGFVNPGQRLSVLGTANASYNAAIGINVDYQSSSTSVTVPIGFSWSSSIGGQGSYWGMGLIPVTFASGSADLGFYTQASERMRITAGGLILLGSNTSQGNGSRLQVSGSMQMFGSQGANGLLNQISSYNTNSSGFEVAKMEFYTGANIYEGQILFSTKDSGGTMAERARIDSIGRFLSGLTSSKSNNAQLQVRRTDATNGALTYPLAWVQNATGFEDGFVVRATDNLVSIGADYGGTNHGVALAFLVNNSAGAFAATEAARIDTSKNLLVGTTLGARSNGGVFFASGSGGVSSARVQNWAATIANNTDTVITPNGALPANSCFLVQVSAYNTTNQNYNRTKLYLVSLRATNFSGSNITQVADSLNDTGTNGEIVTLTTTISSYSVNELSLSVLAAVRSGSPNIIVSITVFGV